MFKGIGGSEKAPVEIRSKTNLLAASVKWDPSQSTRTEGLSHEPTTILVLFTIIVSPHPASAL